MPEEIERKFLVKDDQWKSKAAGKKYLQGYLVAKQGITVRVRTVESTAYLTIKGPAKGITRAEFEYQIPADDARIMLQTLCVNQVIEKTRYIVNYKGNDWQVDVFSGSNEGLVMAEVELAFEDQEFEIPCWAGREVTHDIRYYNAYLSQNPYCGWSEDEKSM